MSVKIKVNTPPKGVSVVEFIGFILDDSCKERDGWKVHTVYDVRDIWGELKGYRVFNPFKSTIFAVLANDASVEIDVQMDANGETSSIIDKIKSQLG